MRNLTGVVLLCLTAACGRGLEAKKFNWKEPGAAEPERAQVLTYTEVDVIHQLGPDTKETYSQRNFISTTYAKDNHAPVLFYLCGEWTCSQAHIDRMVGEYAKRLGAIVVGGEHRFYGESLPHPGTDLTLDDMKYLRTEYAIQDFSEAQKKIMADNHLDGPWFAIGGSYGGTLATYYRLAHPDLVKGSFPFSAPIDVEHQGSIGYEKVAADAFGEKLNKKIRRATDFIFKSLDSAEYRVKLKGLMHLPNTDFAKEDIGAILVNMVPEIAQYGAISSLENSLVDDATDEQLSTALLNALVAIFGDEFWKESPYGMKEDPNFKSDMSKWLYQAFTDFGWLYVTRADVANSLLPIPVTVDHYKERFGKMYGDKVRFISSDYSEKMKAKFLKEGTYMVRFHGSIDPWIAPSLPTYENIALNMFNFLVTGGSHCSPMGPPTDNTESPNYQAQQFFIKKLQEWIAN